ncbi:transposase [Streptomyces lavendulocolor]|uniref:transposase n=1 Tax=Streptomyces lavendulocolor TaxID=67316 RepID=UPI0033E500EA
MSLPITASDVEPVLVLSRFRRILLRLYTRADALLELTDAVLCAAGPVKSLVELTLAAEHRRGHGVMYGALNHGWLEPRSLRRLLASVPLPRATDRRLVLAVDISNWLRLMLSPAVIGCSVTSTAGTAASISSSPGWPYSFVAALQAGCTPLGRPCWTQSVSGRSTMPPP